MSHPGHIHRRGLLRSMAAFAAACTGSGATRESGDTGLGFVSECLGSVDGGELVELVAFVDEDPRELETKTGSGLDARWVLDLERIDAADQTLPQDRLFIRTEAPQGLPEIASDWTIVVNGAVEAEIEVGYDAIAAQSVDQGVVHLECSGNTSFGGFGLQGAVRWAGTPLAWLLDQVTPTAEGALVQVTGLDEHPPPVGNSVPGASWIFRPEDLAEAFLATHIDDEPLQADHGWPVRLVVPGWYGCALIKWITEIRWVAEDVESTSHMREFASRTLQDGTPDLARDFVPAVNDPAATPVRIEHWEVDGQPRIRVVGVVWGAPVEGLRLWADDEDLGLVELCERDSPQGWGLWTSELPIELASGAVTLSLTVDDDVRTRRLDIGYYSRTVGFGRRFR